MTDKKTANLFVAEFTHYGSPSLAYVEAVERPKTFLVKEYANLIGSQWLGAKMLYKDQMDVSAAHVFVTKDPAQALWWLAERNQEYTENLRDRIRAAKENMKDFDFARSLMKHQGLLEISQEIIAQKRSRWEENRKKVLKL
jgi:hypothetical protein